MTDRETIRVDTLKAIEAATNEAELEAIRVAALGKKGSVSLLLASLGTMPIEQRKIEGAANNELKSVISGNLEAKRLILKSSGLEAQLAREALDMTLPVGRAGVEAGRIHPISQVIDEITAIFADMGFSIAEGPDIESDDFNFTKLNFPPDHPAREMHDTFFFAPAPTASVSCCAPTPARCRCARCWR